MARTDVTGVYATCPMINNVIDLINSYANFEEEDLKQKELILSTLEDIRGANGSLRDFGVNLHSKRESEIRDLEKENERLSNKIDDLEENLSLCHSDISTLQKEVEGKDSKISELEDRIYMMQNEYYQ